MNHYGLSYSPRSPSYILSTHYVSGTLLTAVCMFSFNPPGSLWQKYYHPHFTGEDTELREVKQPTWGHTAMSSIVKIQTQAHLTWNSTLSSQHNLASPSSVFPMTLLSLSLHLIMFFQQLTIQTFLTGNQVS